MNNTPNLNDHIKEIEKEFEEVFMSDNNGGIQLKYADEDGRTDYDATKAFLTSKLREIATATLAACDVEEKLLNGGLDKPEDGWYGGWNAAVIAQKKKTEEYLKL